MLSASCRVDDKVICAEVAVGQKTCAKFFLNVQYTWNLSAENKVGEYTEDGHRYDWV